MTKVHVISGFLGAGKTTLIKKLIAGAFEGEKVVLLENEYGEIGIDGGFMKDSGIQVTELNSGCICCTLVGDFSKAIRELIDTYHPDRIIIEPSGVGKLSDIRRVVTEAAETHDLKLCGCAAVVDVVKCKMYVRNFGEFFCDQIESAETILLSRTQNVTEDKINKCVELVREHNQAAAIVTTPWDQLDAGLILRTIEQNNELLSEEEIEHAHEHHHHHHHDHDEHCECGCHDHEHHHEHHEHDEHCECGCHDHEHEHHHEHHEHDEHCECGCHDHEHEHHHEHHEHDEHCECGCHDHEHEHHHEHHEHDEHCECGCHDHEHEHHHDHEHHHEHHHEHGEGCSCGCGHDHSADEAFESYGIETVKKFGEDEIAEALEELIDETKYGMVLRAKGIIPCTDGTWIHFDYVPGESEIRRGSADYTGRLCVIGANLNKDAIRSLLGI